MKTASTANRPRYYVTTWDPERQEWTPQIGVRVGPWTLFGLRKALRRLRTMGYQADRGDSFVLVERCESRAETGGPG